MRYAVLLIGLLLSAPVLAADGEPATKFNGWQGPKPAKPPCECRNKDGEKLQLGAKMCMKRGDQLVTMQCRLVLNNTSWEKVENGCDVAMN